MNEQEYWQERLNTANWYRRRNEEILLEYQISPAVIHKPKLSIDGNMYCFLYGDNLQEGVSGFGKSPDLAMIDFNKNWYKKLK